MSEDTFEFELPKVGIIRGVKPRDIEVIGDKIVNIRVRAKPYSNTYTVEQLETAADVAEKFGSGKIHISPRHNLEIPEVKNSMLTEALKQLFASGLQAGGTGTSVRNIFTCSDYCSNKVRSVRELGGVVSELFGDLPLPNKFAISFAACPSGCSRPYNVDIGIVGLAELEVDGDRCIDDCKKCIEACPVEGAITLEDGLNIGSEKCVKCARCAGACSAGAIKVANTAFKVLVGGKEGRSVIFGKEYSGFAGDYEVIEIIDKAIKQYKKLAEKRDRKKYERIGEIIQRLGSLEAFMNS
ncbi:anaerobic sulfite reductase subunit C [archaeon BMS3Bbin15]|nr:anaerobic sulfite reductase subunit C [archaeon BMS3Bbin15]